jgi:hypothetical protein
MCERKARDIFVCMYVEWSEGLGYMCVYVCCVNLKFGKYVCIFHMYLVKAADMCSCTSDVWIEDFVYICVCMFDVWSEGLGYMFVYVWCVN